MAKVLVTGGAGFIGSHVVDRLVGQGHSVSVVDNLSTGFRQNVSPKARFYEEDIRDNQKMAGIFAKEAPDHVNHHAAQMDVRRSVEDPFFDAENNILGSINLIGLSVKHKVKKFIYISTGGAAYGEPTYLPVDEDHPINPMCQYGISKHTVEHYLHLYQTMHGLKSITLRYPNVYGPRQNPNGEAGVIAIFIGKMMKGESPTIFGDGEQLRDYVYIDDIVDANLAAMNSVYTGIYNLGSEVGTSVNQLYEKLRKLVGFNGKQQFAPARTGEISKTYLRATKARVDLGWSARVSLEDGLKRTVKWFLHG